MHVFPENSVGVTMLKYELIHPAILGVLDSAGHHAKVLIADGNYPASSKRGTHDDRLNAYTTD
jgi:L-fucose mutarotase